MSQLNEKEKYIIGNCLKSHKGELLEVFPGDSHDSIFFLYNQINKPIYGFGNYPKKNYQLIEDKINYVSIKCPPFPNYLINFNTVFICELCWIIVSNGKILNSENNILFKGFIEFLKKILKDNGQIIFTRTSYLEIIIFGLDCAKNGLNLIFDMEVGSNNQPVFVLKRSNKTNMLESFQKLYNQIISK